MNFKKEVQSNEQSNQLVTPHSPLERMGGNVFSGGKSISPRPRQDSRSNPAKAVARGGGRAAERVSFRRRRKRGLWSLRSLLWGEMFFSEEKAFPHIRDRAPGATRRKWLRGETGRDTCEAARVRAYPPDPGHRRLKNTPKNTPQERIPTPLK